MYGQHQSKASGQLYQPSLARRHQAPILLGQSEVDDVDLVGLLSQSN